MEQVLQRKSEVDPARRANEDHVQLHQIPQVPHERRDDHLE